MFWRPYGIDQTDLALRRRFNLTERLKLDVRAEYFNVFNHPMFGDPGFNQPNTEFGVSGLGKVVPRRMRLWAVAAQLADKARCMH